MDDKKKKQQIRKNFLESLKEIGSDVGKSTVKDLLTKMPQSAANQIFGPGSAPNETGQDKFPSPENKERFRWSRQEFTNIRVQERMVFKRAEEEIKAQIEAIRAELAKLVMSTQGLAKEVRIASVAAPVEPGVYHLSFLESLREFIIFMRKNITESKNWLAVCNAKAKKRNYYWGQFKKSGTKFLLSSERYMSTQAG